MREFAIRLKIRRVPEGYFVATSPDVPGFLVQARTLTELAEEAQDVARMIRETCIEHGDPLPPALADAVASADTAGATGVFSLRIPVGIA